MCDITPIPDQKPPADPCPTREVSCLVRITALVAEGITPAHLLEYVLAMVQNRAPRLRAIPVDVAPHEDIYDHLTAAAMDAEGWPVAPESAAVPGGSCPACHGTGFLLVRHEEPCAACAGAGKVAA